MCLFQILTNAIASFPFAAINLYRALTTQEVQTQDQENIVQFLRVMAIWLFYVQYCSDFYIYVSTSTEVRAAAAKILCFWNRRWNVDHTNELKSHCYDVNSSKDQCN